MNTMRRLLCAIQGGHRWETVEDDVGPLTTCSRCGAVQHTHSGEAPESPLRMGPLDSGGGD